MIYFAVMKYMDIYTALKADITDRAFAEDKRLPGEPELCRRFGTARNTVRQALALLQQQGLIERRKGEGTFITRSGERKTGIIGLYEGAGYSLKGVYRPEYDCRMRTNENPEFCTVCREAIVRLIEFYCK